MNTLTQTTHMGHLKTLFRVFITNCHVYYSHFGVLKRRNIQVPVGLSPITPHKDTRLLR